MTQSAQPTPGHIVTTEIPCVDRTASERKLIMPKNIETVISTAVASADVSSADTANLIHIGGDYTVDIAANYAPLLVDREAVHAGHYIFSGYPDALERALKVAVMEIAALRLLLASR